MRLSCQENLIPGDNLVAKWEFVSAAGFDAIELHGHGDFAFQQRLPELFDAKDAGAVMPTVCVIMDHFIGDFDASRRRDAIDNMKSLLSVIAEIGGSGAITPAAYGLFSKSLPPFRPPRSPEEDRAVLVDALIELGEHAELVGVSVFLEPLNRYEDYMINRVEQAIELCEHVGLGSLKVMGDFFHMNIEEKDIAETIHNAVGHLAHVHLSDSNRLQPGAGHIDFAPGFRALQEIGYDGDLAVECRMDGDAAEELPRVARYLRSLL
ncbi:MAG: sugar phosphate isomerase/epimerase [Actinomycetota bacterium]|nr:sugar phosphate isomerase/epimerase [Actinomycetota bacterium]